MNNIQFIGGKNEMPITGYFGPSIPWPGIGLPDHITDERFAAIAEMGINMITYTSLDYATHPELARKMLELGEKYGVGIFITDTRVIGRTADDTLTKEDVETCIADYKDYPAFCGMYLVDEPDAPYYFRRRNPLLISGYEKLADILQRDLDILCYCNALPHNGSLEERESYQKYLNEFCDTFRPKIMMYDYYPYGEGSTPERYFWNLNNMRKHADEMQVPLWMFVQAGGNWHEDDEYAGGSFFPNEPEFQWNVNTGLAFGAKGIQYFPLMQPNSFAFVKKEEGEFERNGLIGANGQLNKWYYYAQRINRHIRAIDEILMNSVNEGLIAFGQRTEQDTEPVEYMIESKAFRELLSADGEALVGCFDYNGKTALYVVNYSNVLEQKITLKFNDVYQIKCIQNAESFCLQGDELMLNMAAGEGILVLIE